MRPGDGAGVRPSDRAAAASPAARAEHLAKRFHVLRAERTALRALRALLRGESLRRELWVLKDVSFEIARGAKVALVGRNGSGKTTLLRLLSGIYAPTAGRLEVADRPRPLFSCGVGFASELSVSENVLLFGTVHGIRRHRLRERRRDILARADLAPLAHVPVKDLSTGQVQRLALAVFAEAEAEFVILDEVIGNVDAGFLREADRFFRALVDSPRTVLMTSHDASFLRAYCDEAMWIDGGAIRLHGRFDAVLREYERSFGEPEADPAARRERVGARS
ncbi:MAG TPA: ATP-binding cassette domain-containing protein [Candidatus Binatia bacterium]|nr:ATP-binding cassette domain-containing protein [Candidatus Binatia bacterium]